MSIFPSILYVGIPTPTANNNPDTLVLQDHSIQSIRSIPTFFATKPLKSKNKLCLIPQAHLLQIPAQNALLKVLEEPGNGNFIELYTNYPQRLLGTIRSRCQIISPQTINRHCEEILSTWQSRPPSLQLSDSLATDKDSVSAWILNQINAYQHELIVNPNVETAKKIKSLIKALNMLQNNVDARSCLDWLFLS